MINSIEFLLYLLGFRTGKGPDRTNIKKSEIKVGKESQANKQGARNILHRPEKNGF